MVFQVLDSLGCLRDKVMTIAATSIKLPCKISTMAITGKINLYTMGNIIPCLLLFVFINSPCLAHSIRARSESGWAIRQSSNFAGTVFSDLTPHALRMHIGRLGLTIITKAPRWDALVFNENSKTYAILPYKRWQQRFSVNAKSSYRDEHGRLALIVKNTGRTMTIEHYKAYECWVIRKSEPQKHIEEQKISQLWIASDIKLPPQIAQIFCSHLGIPAQKGIPLKASHNTNGKMVSVLETLCVERRTMPQTNFDPLPGYKKVKNEIELVMGESSDESMNDLLDIPGSNLDLPASKHKAKSGNIK